MAKESRPPTIIFFYPICSTKEGRFLSLSFRMATAPRGSASPQRRTGTPSGATDKAAKRRANDLLRNYYGLSSSASSASAAANPDGTAGLPSLATVRPVGPPDTGDARDPDSSKFDSALAFKLLLREKGLSQLLADESDLLTEIRELDGERQSLVYNHHHELVAASETIRKVSFFSRRLSVRHS